MQAACGVSGNITKKYTVCCSDGEGSHMDPDDCYSLGYTDDDDATDDDVTEVCPAFKRISNIHNAPIISNNQSSNRIGGRCH